MKSFICNNSKIIYMLYRKTSVLIIIILSVSFSSISQEAIKTIKKFNQISDYQFTNEWQYLSTELYLFNQTKFTKLVNDLYPQKKKSIWPKKMRQENIEYLMITANIKDVKYFGGDLTYPIYSFQATQDNENGYNVHVSDNDDVIHLIDNLPLPPTTNYIDALIEGKIITDKDKDKVIRTIADQLIQISAIPNPSGAALSVISELGKFMKTGVNKNMYKFNSTIRLYESRDFNKRFYSITLYVFVPSGKKAIYLKTDKLSDYLISNDNPEINREKLESLINFKSYPYFAVVNYKSKYSTEDVIGDEITFENIRLRRVRIQNKYDKGSIPNKSTYNHEMNFLDFLEQFANFKSTVNTYRLNRKNKTFTDFSRSISLICKQYQDLINLYNTRNIEFIDDDTYINSFKDKYASILTTAGLYLEADNQLKNGKALVNTLSFLENNNNAELSEEEYEKHLRNLYSLVLPSDDGDNDLFNQVNDAITELEMKLYRKYYEKYLQELDAIGDRDKGLEIKNRLIDKIKTSNCKYCRSRISEEVEKFNAIYSRKIKKEALINNQKIVANARDEIFYALMKEDCVNRYFNKFSADNQNIPAHISMLKNIFDELVLKRTILQEYIEINFDDLPAETIIENNKNLNILINAINEGYKGICSKVSNLCECE